MDKPPGLSIFLLIFLSLVPATDQNVRQKRQTVTSQPRLITQSGHLVFQTGDNHNITFRSSNGGSINLDGEDLTSIIQIVKINKAQVEDLVRKNTAVQSRLSNVENSVTTINQIQNTLNTISTQITSLSSRVDDIENRPLPTSSSSQPNNNNNNALVRRLRTRVTRLESQMRRLNRLLTRNECASNPCQNGGTCVDLYNGFTCRCPPSWQGARCSEDVNECATLAGTDLGCQNGATCTNVIGSFRCTCPPNYRGIRCSETHEDCTDASAQELCGHGTCVNVPRVHPNLPKYNCICDDGWTQEGGNPACIVDVNECNSNNPPCSQDPPVQCINLPGTFHCGNCPVGYTGNGFSCADINECLINNGGCSQAPLVQCINTRGSSVCGQCPAGYQGNGQVCLPVSGGVCNSNNGGCHPVASCIENAAVPEGRTCHCPPGYQGSGVGPSGCVLVGTVAPGNPCFNNPCGSNGQCQVNGNTYQCLCNPGFSGTNCQVNINECASNPCQNGGTCTDGNNRFVCQCPSTHTGNMCQTPVGCGAALTGETGSLAFPQPNGQEYPHGVSCAWTITTTVNKVISVQFTRFDIEYHQNCDYDFLQIHDGLTASAYQIGKFCGNTAPLNGTFNSTHHQLYFWFRSDGSVAGHGFGLQWTTTDPYCGGDIRGRSHGSIQSPGYPGNYPHNRDCVWTIAVATNKKIMFQFGTLALEHHDNCTYDFLELRDGLRETDPLLGRYCSTTDPAPVRSTGPTALIRFHSDESLSDRGFHITYSEVDGPVSCGGDYTSDNGVIISPNYPNPYNHNDQCIWTLTVPQSEVITLTFTNMDLEAHSNCQFDYVEVRDGGDEYANLVGRYCGTLLPPPFVSGTNRLWVKFKSDVSNRGSGFRATWTVACGGRFTTPTGTIQSPYFPGNYPNEKECIYIIAQPVGSRITLTFQSFDIENGNDAGCSYDYLEVRDGSGPEATLLGRLCGNGLPAAVTSTGENLWLKFKSDGSVQNNGFSATYEINDAGADCGGSLTGQSGSFHSPGHPNVYPHGVNCTWSITVQDGYIVRLTFHAFSMEADANCRYDYVEIFDSGNETSVGNSLGRYCGSTLPPARQSRDNRLTVALVTDSSVSHEGFAASFVALNESVSCHNELTDLVGVITSPNWPGTYPHQKQCEWIITVPQDHQIQLNVTDFQMEQHANCDYDYVEIRNGGYETSPLIGTYCGTTIDNPIRSHSNKMYIKFKSDVSQTAPGFRIFYDGSSTGCGGVLMTPSGSLTSPNYPAAYGHNAECYWTIQVAAGSTIQLMFVDFDIEAHSSCAYDYVEIRETDANGPSISKYCGGQTPQPVNSRTNQMWIKLRTDYSNSGRGFLAAYNALCNTRLTDRRGAIESPNFPQPYPHDRECTWVIEATLGNTVNISFSHLDIEAHDTCNYDYLEIRDGQDESATSLGKFCGQNLLPSAMASSGQYLWIKFKSDASVASNGFRLEWIMSGCGDDLSGESGSLTSPGYPNPYPHRQVCVWTITVPSGKAVELTISDFDLESHSSCNYDVLEVFGGIDDTAPRLTQLCHTQTSPQVVQSTGNKMYIRFKSDVSVNGRGFTATYLAKDGGCGGNYSTPTATILSSNYPNNYPSTTDCLYQITVQENRVVQLTFEDFDVETHANCSYDYVALYDGPDINSPLILRYCGNALPSPVTYRSSSNQMTVRMKTDGSITARGFKATYVTGCGGRLSAETDGEITSPNYPEPYEHNNNCSWIIDTDSPTDRVTLIFTHMDLEDYNNCSADFVMVADGNNPDAPVLGTYCGTRIPPPITSFSGALYVQFVSDQSAARTGFRAIFSKSTSFCGGDLTSQQGGFNSPGYPDNYPRETECVWTITASPGNRIQLAFTMFNLENHYLCNYDYVEIRDGGVSGDLVGRYCGSNIPSNLTSSNSLWVKFRSNQANSGRGFMAEYTTVYGGDISGTSGQVASPMYPSQYPHNAHAVWVITVPVGQVVRVAFDVLDMETSDTCYYDYIKFLDGGAADGLELGKYCGTTVPAPFTSTGNQLYVEFHSDASGAGQGFLFNWQAVSTVITTPSPTQSTTPIPGCGGQLQALETGATLVSPGYPDGYADNLDCVWTIRSVPGQRIWFNISYINLEAHSACNYDKLVLFDNDAPIGRVLGTFCGRQPNDQPIIATSNAMTARFTTDSSVNRTGFAATYKASCGGILDAATGVIQSPSYPSNYPSNANCTWTIRVANGRTISVEFETFNIQSSSSCSGDYLMLLNGDNSGSPPLGNNAQGKYCGTTAPANINTTSNRMYVNFYSDGSGSAQGFKMIYREVSVACGGRLTLTNDVRSGFFSTPNYPEPYPHNVDCIWVITVPSTEQVQLDFVGDFNIEAHSECRYDYVRVRDGGTENGEELGTFCGRTKPSTQRSSGNIMYVRFRTDDSVPRTGFRAQYQISTCGGTINGDSGSIMSPNYPDPYGNGANCEWYVNGPTGHYMTFTFEAFSLQQSDNCLNNDYLQIRDRNKTGPILGSLCGSSLPSPIRTSDSFAYLNFKTDRTTTDTGFKVNFEASVEGCGGELNTPNGVITSPNYPGSYPHSRTCTWRITVQPGRRVSLEFTDINIEAHSRCSYDYIEVFNGILRTSPSLGYFCGTTNPGIMKSSGNTMTVVFVTDGSVTNGGFRAQYTSQEAIKCGGPITNADGNSGTLSSPGFQDGNYTNNEQCVWVLTNTNGGVNSSIGLRFSSFALEEHGSCNYDYLEIREGADETATLIGRYCGNTTIPPRMVSASPYLWIMFRSDHSIVDRGFSLDYNFTRCGGVLLSQQGVITSPNYPNNYDHFDQCGWEILAPENYQIIIEVTNLNIEDNDKCQYDYLEIFNGGTSSSPSIGKFCGTTIPEAFRSQSNRVRIEFHADSSVSASGFRLTYRMDGGGCGGTLHGKKGYISSPNYPNRYPHNAECMWEINTEPGYHVILTFNPPFDLENAGNCIYDYVEVSDYAPSNDSWSPVARHCGNSIPESIQSVTNRLLVKFHSNSNINGNGFSASWEAGCGALYTQDSGVLVSPGFPGNYENNLTCNYQIRVDPQKFVVLTFDDENFRIEGGTDCPYDYIAAYSGNDTSSTRLGKFCGSTAPQAVSSLGAMFIQFVTDGSIVDRGYRATYSAMECGGTYTSPQGTIRTPQHPVNYHHNANCTWSITVQSGRVVELKFNIFDIETHSSCNYDYVEIRDGSSLSSPLIGRFCGNVLPEPVRTTGNTMMVNFVSDASINGAGFTASYRTTFGVPLCGGFLNGTQGRFGSFDIDGDGLYENDLNCVWQIVGQDNKVLNLTFEAMDIENDNTCDYDYLEVRDGLTSDDPLVGKYCGNRAVTYFVSSSNMVYVKFYTDGSVAGRGFNITYRQVDALCGGVRTASTAPQTISSPNYPNEYPHNLRCRWTIDTTANQQIDVNVTDMNVESHANCVYDYLELRDKPLGDTGQRLLYCGSQLPPLFTSVGRTMQINFVTDASARGTGFSLTYQIASCNRTHSGANGRITSPGWPGTYPSNTRCYILVQSPPGTYLSLYFNAFYIEPHSSCNFDYLEIRNGSEATSELVGRFCGNTLPDPVFASGNSVWMHLNTDNSVTHPGYDITFASSSTAQGCGGRFTDSSGSFTSPMYPQPYANSRNCTWLVQVPSRKIVTVRFTAFNIEYHESCNYDWVDVHDGPSTSSPRVGRYCGDSMPAEFTGTGRAVTVFFRSDQSQTGPGFRIAFSTTEPAVMATSDRVPAG